MANWKTMLGGAMEEHDESLADIEANTMTEQDMAKEFNDGYGSPDGCPFTVWTKTSVYFPMCYDGAEWVGRVSRNPDGKPTEHQGG